MTRCPRCPRCDAERDDALPIDPEPAICPECGGEGVVDDANDGEPE